MQAEVVPLRFPSLPEKCKVKQQPANLPYNLLIITFLLEAEKLQLLFIYHPALITLIILCTLFTKCYLLCSAVAYVADVIESMGSDLFSP